MRAAASGHSFTDIACTDGVMLRLERMNRVLEVDRGAGLAKVEAGIVIRDLSEALAREGLALENLGDIDVQTVAGAISTATHGTGERFGNISAQVEALELVTADGSVVECSRESDPDLWRAARVGLGSLGAIATVTFRVVPAFTIRRHDHPLPLDEAFARLDELAAANDHFEFYVFPHTRTALCRESKHTEEPPDPYGRVRGVPARDGAREPRPRAAVRDRQAVPRAHSGDQPPDHPHPVRIGEDRCQPPRLLHAAPGAVHRDGVRDAARETGRKRSARVLDMIERRGYAVPFPIEYRIVAGDDAYLSTAHERDTVYIAVHMYRGMTWEPYFRAVEAIMDDYEGRPHWGKRHFQSAATLAPRYPEWDRFQAVRARLDPEGHFQNEYAKRVLGPVGTRRGGVAPSPHAGRNSSGVCPCCQAPAGGMMCGMDAPRRIVIVGFPGVQTLDMIGPAEVFRTADALEPGTYSVEVVAAESGPLPSTSVGLVADRAFRNSRGAIDTLIVPGGPGSRDAARDRATVSWVRARRGAGRAACAPCAPARSSWPRPACSTATAPPPTGRAATGSRSVTRM